MRGHLNPNPVRRGTPPARNRRKPSTSQHFQRVTTALPTFFLGENGKPHRPTIAKFNGLVFNGARFAKTGNGGHLLLSGAQSWVLKFMPPTHPKRKALEATVEALRRKGLDVRARESTREGDFVHRHSLVRKPGTRIKRWWKPEGY